MKVSYSALLFVAGNSKHRVCSAITLGLTMTNPAPDPLELDDLSIYTS